MIARLVGQMRFPWNAVRRQRRSVDSMLQSAKQERRDAARLRLDAELVAQKSGDRSRRNHLPEAIAALMPPHKGVH